MVKEQKQYNKEEERKLDAKNEIKEFTEKISKKRSEIKNYVKSFKADIKRKKKAYQIALDINVQSCTMRWIWTILLLLTPAKPELISLKY